MDPHEYETHETEVLTNSQGKQPLKQPFTVSSLMDAHYLITFASGRTAVMKSGYDVYQAVMMPMEKLASWTLSC